MTAILTAVEPLSMPLTLERLGGEVTVQSSSQIHYGSGEEFYVLFGEFNFESSLLTGLGNRLVAYGNQTLVWSIDNLYLQFDSFNLNAASLQSLVQTEVQAELEDSNVTVGSRGQDILYGYGGNDFFLSISNGDLIDGGEGYDKVGVSDEIKDFIIILSESGVQLVPQERGEIRADDSIILSNVEFIEFDRGEFDLENFGYVPNLTPGQFEDFIELYIAYFNRAPDSLGLNFWGTAFYKGVTLPEIAELFMDQEETLLTYPPGTSNAEFAQAVYSNIFGRVPDQAGFEFWVDMLNRSSETGVSRDKFILEVLKGVEDGSRDRVFLDMKTDIGAYYSVHRGMSDVENAKSVMANFDGSEASFDDAMTEANAFYEAALSGGTNELLVQVIGLLDIDY